MNLPQHKPFKTFDNRLESTFIMNPSRFESGAVGGWVELGRTTLGSANATINVSSLPDKRYYMTLSDLQSTTTVNNYIRLNSDSGSNYSKRLSENGGAEDPNTNFTAFDYLGSSDSGTNQFGVSYFSNLSSKEKLGIHHFVAEKTAGAGTAPNRLEGVGKWANTSSAINAISNVNLSNTLNSGSEVVVLGWDPADTHTNNFWEELASVDITSASNLSSGTITAKKYLWYQYHLKLGATQNGDITYNNDTGSNYAIRFSDDGGADGTATSVGLAGNDGGGTSGETIFANVFVINNTSNEKLAIAHFINSESSGAGNAPTRREAVHKWANTSSQITEIDLTANTGTFTSGSLRVWGSN